MVSRMIRLRHLAAVAFVAPLLVSGLANAAPLRCSDEEKACMVICAKTSDPRKPSPCVTNCQARQSVCRQTGCWDNGALRYCGLLRQ
jgi:hypothetical protein